MALKDLERLTGELQRLTSLLKEETRSQARLLIMRRCSEIMAEIKEGEGE